MLQGSASFREKMSICYLTKLLELATPRAGPTEYDPANPSAEIVDATEYDPASPTPPNSPRDPTAYDPEDPSCDLTDGPDYDPASPAVLSVVVSVLHSPTTQAYGPTAPTYMA